MTEQTNLHEPGKKLHLVIYSDGGCRWTPPMAGGGAHGYFYTTDENEKLEKVSKENLPKKDTPTSCGYVDDNNLAQLINMGAVVVKPTTVVDCEVPVPYGTNNLGELHGMEASLTVALMNQVDSVTIAADSKYVLEGMQSHMYKWEKGGWSKAGGIPLQNVENWKRIHRLVCDLKENGTLVRSYWVMGHSGNLGNDTADDKATRALISASKSLKEPSTTYKPFKGYRNYKASYNRLFCHSAWYFSTISSQATVSNDGRYIYYTGRHGKDNDFHGKVQSDGAYGILFLKEQEPTLEAIRNYQETINYRKYGSPFIGNIQAIFTTKNLADLQEHKDRYVHRAGIKQDLSYPGGVSLTIQCDPPMMAWNAEVYMNALRDVYIDHASGASTVLTVTDITDLMYEEVEVKKKTVCRLKGEILPTTRALDVDVQYNVTGITETCKLTLTLGIDTPPRTALAAICSEEKPSVKVITWRESDHGFRYAVITEVGGDSGIWSGVFSNLRILSKK